jgi:hypothetical protein
MKTDDQTNFLREKKITWWAGIYKSRLITLGEISEGENSVSLLAIYSLVYLRRNWFYFSAKLLFNPIPVPRHDSQNKVWNRRGQQTCSGNWIVCIQVKPILVGDQIHSQTKVTESPRSTNLLSQKEH